jgi:hypothetical protein
VVVVVTLLSLGLGTLLLLNTLLAQGSFALYSLEAQVASLADQEQALQQKAAELAAPQRLERRARSLGMVPSANPAFLRAKDGEVLGVPIPAAGPAPVVGSSTSEPASADQQNDEPRDAAEQKQDQQKQDQQKQDQQKQDQQKQDQQKQDQQNGGGTG